jgi:hypothetical protein
MVTDVLDIAETIRRNCLHSTHHDTVFKKVIAVTPQVSEYMFSKMLPLGMGYAKVPEQVIQYLGSRKIKYFFKLFHHFGRYVVRDITLD